MGEYSLNAALAGHFEVPVLMVTGDQTACAQASELLGEVEFFNSAMADHAMRMPGAERDGTCISLSLPDMVAVYNAFRAMVALATMG